MKITTYNPDGTVLKEDICNIEIPEHIKAFNEGMTPYCFNTGDIELINSKKASFARTMLVDRLYFLVALDYHNYLTDYQSAFSKDITPSLKDQAVDYEYKIVEYSIAVILRCYNLKSGIQRLPEDSEFEKISINKWIDSLLLHAKRTAARNCKTDYNYAIYIAWLNLLHSYYYGLKNYQKFHSLPRILEEQIDILAPFANINRHKTDQVKIESLVNSLFKIDLKNRAFIYDVIRISNSLQKNVGSFLEFGSKISLNYPISTLHKFCIAYNNENPSVLFELTSQELGVLSIEKEAQKFISNVITHVKKIYDAVKQSEQVWLTSEIQKDATNFSQERADWPKYYLSLLQGYQNQYDIDRCGNQEFQPESCYHYILLLENKDAREPIDFTANLIINLLHVLKHNNCPYQKGLFEGMYIINYVKEQLSSYDNDLPSASRLKANRYLSIEEKKKLDIALCEIHKFLEPILIRNNHSFLNAQITDEQFLNLIDGILSDSMIYKEFIEGPTIKKDLCSAFNLKYFLNILGVLVFLSRDSNDKQIIDVFQPNISVSALTKKLLNEASDTNTQKYINQYEAYSKEPRIKSSNTEKPNTNAKKWSTLTKPIIKQVRLIAKKYLSN